MNYLKIPFTLGAVLLLSGCSPFYYERTEVPYDPGFDTGAMEAEVNRDPYGKAEKAFNRVVETIKPSGKLDPIQTEYSMADRLTWYEKLQWSKDCEAEYRLSSDKEEGGLAFYKVSDKKYLVRISCYQAAYQGGMIFFMVNADGQNISGKKLEPGTYNVETKTLGPWDNGEDHQILGLDYFDKKTNTISIFTKSRGIGDCGSRHTYTVEKEKLVLTKLESQSCEEADKKALENPDGELTDWPVIYEKK